MSSKIYIASAVDNGGIYRYNVNDDGSLTYLDKSVMPRPMYMEIFSNRMYIILRSPFDGSNVSGMTSCAINSDGSLGEIGEILSTQGTSGCHITVNTQIGSVYCANYSSGSLIKFDANGSKLVVHSGTGPNKARQECPHVHQVIFTPDNKYLCATDLGLDSVFLYDHNLNFISKASVPAGYGPRHTVFSPCGKYAYCVSELISAVTSFEYDGNSLITRETVSSLPADFNGVSYGSAIRCTKDGKFIYASNRGHNSIACFHVEGTKLELFETIPCGGNWPRDFNITPDENFLYCTNELGNNVAAYKRDKANGTLERLDYTLELPTPLCAVFA